jgi:tetratricopeptide (TPR) repeat protein
MKLGIIRAVWILVLLISIMGCGGKEARKAKYTAVAQKYMEAGNWPKARVALRNVLKIDPRNAGAYFLYAQVEEKEKNWNNAFGNYLKVVELEPDHLQALTRLGKFYLEGGAPDKALEMANRILAKHPDDAVGEAIGAAVMAKKGQLTVAVAKAEAVNQRHPENPDAAIVLAFLYANQKRENRSEKVLERALRADPRNILLLVNLGNILVQSGKMDEAEEVFRRIAEAEPNLFDHRMRLAALYDHEKKPEKAEAVLREAIRLESEDEPRWLALAEFLIAHREIQKEESLLLDASKALPDSMRIRFALGKLYEMTGRADKAHEIYEATIDEKGKLPPGLEAQVKLASLELAEGKREAAKERINHVLKENPLSSEALILHGRMALAQGDGKEAVQSFRTVLKDQPQMAEVQALLGQAYLLVDEKALARESLEKAVSLNARSWDAHRALVRLDLSEGRQKEARSHLDLILNEAPKDLDALSLLADLQVRDRDWRGAETTLSRMREAGLDAYLLSMAEGNLNRAQKKWDSAVAAFEQALALRPEAPDPLSAILRIELDRHQVERAHARLHQILSARPDHPYAHGMLGEVLLVKKDWEGAEREFQVAVRLKPDWITPWLDQANLKLAQGKSSEAVGVLETALKTNPKSADLRMMLASTLVKMDEVDRAIAEYEKVLKENPQMLLAANNLAMVLTDNKGDPESLKRAFSLAQGFEKQAPHPAFLDTLGWVYVKMGQEGAGVRVLRQVVEKAPDQPVFNYHLGIAYYKIGGFIEARRYLTKALGTGKSFPGVEEARLTLSQIHD